MTEKEIAILLVRNGIANQKRKPDEYTEANEDENVKALGNAAIANSLEFLGKHKIVADVQPTFSYRGLGFAYRISPQFVEELSSDELVSNRIESLFEAPSSETSSTITELLKNCEKTNLNAVYRDDLLASLKELRLCFAYECYIACLALSGKILEICLKQLMMDNNIHFENNWMIGKLLQKLRESQCEKYLDQSLPEIANIINKSRIPAVHAKEKIPVPSREQAVMVIHAVVDTVNRVIIRP
jgi:hypothetical protein